jgi:pimeloyl-ACP methyl ester carboxylesterase
MRLRRLRIIGVILCLCAAPLRAQGDSPALPRGATETPAPGDSAGAVGAAIPRADLERMYRHELEGLYRPADVDKVYAAHLLIERFFAAKKAVERRQFVNDIEATGLDPVLIGRLCRIRMHWPALEGGGIYYINERFGPHTVRYFVGIPKDYDRTRPWPLVIKLPGADAFASGPRPNGDQVAGIYRGWMEQELERHPDAVCVMPLLDLDELWGPSYAGMNRVIQPMHHVAWRVNVDPARVYVLGHSLSGHAAWNLALHYPTFFAAFNPLAGSATGDWQRLRLINLRNVLPVVWHDVNDDAIPVARVRSLVNAIKKLKLDVDYEETKGVGHTPTEQIADSAYTKMRARVRDLYPKQVWLQSNRPDTLFNRVDWVQVYQSTNPGKEQRFLLRRGTGQIYMNQNAFRVDASVVSPNHIEIKTDNVQSMRLYFNDHLVDLKKPVTVIVNKKPRFEGLVKPSVQEMLNDQLFLGRGWRYYTAVLDLDLGPPPPTTRPTTLPARRPVGARPASPVR